MVILNFSYILCARCGVFTSVESLHYVGFGRYLCVECASCDVGGHCTTCREYDCTQAACSLDGEKRVADSACKYSNTERVRLAEIKYEKR